MGASNNKSESVIQLEKDNYEAGEDIKGSVILSQKLPVSNLQLFIHFIGKEKFDFKEKDYPYHNELSHSKVGFMMPPENLQPGNYQFPFIIKTLSHFPSSVRLESPSFEYSLRIKYYLKALFKSDDNTDLMCKLPVNIIQKQAFFDRIYNQKPSKILSKYFKYETTEESDLKVEIPQKRYAPNEMVEISIFQNEETQKTGFKNLKISLHRVISVKKPESKFQVWRRVFMGVLKIKLTKFEKNMAKDIKVNYQLNLEGTELLGCGSSYGEIIKSKYFFEVSTKEGIFAKRKRVFVPISVVNHEALKKLKYSVNEVVTIPCSYMDLN